MAKMTLEDLAAQLGAAYGGDLVSVVLYGSAAGGEHTKRSDQNVLVVVKEVGLSHMKAAASVSRAWSDAGNPAPLTFTEREWRGSADIFPMEYADILERNRVLAGKPPFDGISVDREDLRLQLEHEAMGKLLKLRQGVLATGGDERRLLELVTASLSTLMVIFRAFVRLHGDVPPADNLRLVDEVARRASFAAEPFARAVRHARGEAPIPPKDAPDLVGGYIGGMERLVSYLDRYATA
jgi:hypothetical protein